MPQLASYSRKGKNNKRKHKSLFYVFSYRVDVLVWLGAFFLFTSLDLGAGCPESCVVYSATVSGNATWDFRGPGCFRGGEGAVSDHSSAWILCEFCCENLRENLRDKLRENCLTKKASKTATNTYTIRMREKKRACWHQRGFFITTFFTWFSRTLLRTSFRSSTLIRNLPQNHPWNVLNQ